LAEADVLSASQAAQTTQFDLTIFISTGTELKAGDEMVVEEEDRVDDEAEWRWTSHPRRTVRRTDQACGFN
jgi:hypothetical protein